MESERLAGLYWIKIYGHWEVGQWDNDTNGWWTIGSEEVHRENSTGEIERIQEVGCRAEVSR